CLWPRDGKPDQGGPGSGPDCPPVLPGLRRGRGARGLRAEVPSRAMKKLPKGPDGKLAKNAKDLAWEVAQEHKLSYPPQVNPEIDIGLALLYSKGQMTLEEAYDVFDDLIGNIILYEVR